MASKHTRDLKAVKQVRAEKAQKIQELWDLEAKEDRQLEQEERDEIHDLTKALKELEKQQEEIEANLALEKQVKEASQGIVSDPEPVQTDAKVNFEPPRMRSLGEQFTESKAYQDFWGGGNTPTGDWQTPTVDLSMKATLTSGGTVSGYGPYTEFVPGVIQQVTQQLTVADLLPSNNASAPQIQFFRERLATNSAAGVAEASGKPESVLDFNSRTLALAKVATYLPVTDEMLEDAPQIQGYINQRLSMFIRTEEERQILRGKVASSEVEGIIGAPSNYTSNGVGSAILAGTAFANRGTAVYNSLLKIINNTRGSGQMDPTALICHPTQFGTLISRSDTAGQFYGGGPLTPGLYGGGGNAGANRLSQGAFSVWTVPVYITTAIGAGTMLLGNFRDGAALHRKGGISVQASNSHSDFFKKNLTAIRAEERLALTVYRPEAFTVIKWK